MGHPLEFFFDLVGADRRTDSHWHAVEWLPVSVDFRVGGWLVRTALRALDYRCS